MPRTGSPFICSQLLRGSQLLRSIIILGAAQWLSGCEQSTSSPQASESRVQAVQASTTKGSTPEPTPETKPALAAGAKPRAAFCAGQELASKTFTPKQTPRKVAASGEAALPELNFSSKRWTWVNFWAAWCVPCKQELPLLLQWQNALRADLDFAFVSLDDDARQLDQFLADQPAAGLKSSYWLPDGPVRQGWLAAMDMTSEPELPMQLLLDPSGKVRCRIQGAVEAEDKASLERIVRGQN